jgi:hypothetical protein
METKAPYKNEITEKLFSPAVDGTLLIKNISCLDLVQATMVFYIYATDLSTTRNHSAITISCHQRQAPDSAAVLFGLSGVARHCQRVRGDPAGLVAAQLWRRYPDESARLVLALLSVAKAQSRVLQVRVSVYVYY